jgi:hypothetical protein
MERRNAYKILGIKEIQASLERMWHNVKKNVLRNKGEICG